MLGPILQALSQQVVPQITQFLSSPAFPQLINNLQRIPPVFWLQGARTVSKGVSDWYDSLSPEAKKRLEDAITWAIKDLSIDFLKMSTAAATGLPTGPLVDLLVNKVLAKQGHEKNAPELEKAFIQLELQRQLQNRIK